MRWRSNGTKRCHWYWLRRRRLEGICRHMEQPIQCPGLKLESGVLLARCSAQYGYMVSSEPLTWSGELYRTPWHTAKHICFWTHLGSYISAIMVDRLLHHFRSHSCRWIHFCFFLCPRSCTVQVGHSRVLTESIGSPPSIVFFSL